MAMGASQGETLEFRPSRGSLWWLIPVEIVFSVLVGGLFLRESPYLMILFIVLLAGINVGMTLTLKVRARTVVEPGGLRIRTLGQRLFPWPEVRAVDTVPTLAGRVIRVTMANGFAVGLLAPRHGLLRADPRFDEAIAAIGARITAAHQDGDQTG